MEPVGTCFIGPGDRVIINMVFGRIGIGIAFHGSGGRDIIGYHRRVAVAKLFVANAGYQATVDVLLNISLRSFLGIGDVEAIFQRALGTVIRIISYSYFAPASFGGDDYYAIGAAHAVNSRCTGVF